MLQYWNFFYCQIKKKHAESVKTFLFCQMMLFLDTVHLEEEDWGRVLHVMPNKMLKNHPFRPRMPLAEQFTDIDSDGEKSSSL